MSCKQHRKLDKYKEVFVQRGQTSFVVNETDYLADKECMSFLPLEFLQFIDLKCNRFDFLKKWLLKEKIPFSVLPIEGKNHIFVNFPKESYNSLFKTKTLLIHYDRVENTPGANDNSAAVFQGICLAKRLLLSPQVHNMRLIFTDGEELGGTKQQGAFGIAALYKRLGLSYEEVFVIDGSGRGDVLVVSTAGKSLSVNQNFTKRFENLYNITCNLAMASSPERWVTIPVPYGDNAGFIASGIPAVAITVLPSEEVSVYMRQLQKAKSFAQLVMDRQVGKRESEEAQKLLVNETLPWTWRAMHTQYDDISMLTQEAFGLMQRFLDNLSESKTVR